MLDEMTSTTDKPTKAQAYCVERFPKLRTTPPAIANKTDDQLSCIKFPWIYITFGISDGIADIRIPAPNQVG